MYLNVTEKYNLVCFTLITKNTKDVQSDNMVAVSVRIWKFFCYGSFS